MTRRHRALAAPLLLALALAGCGRAAGTWSAGTDALTRTGARLAPDWGGPRVDRPGTESLTALRVRGGAPEVAPTTLLPESGNVWPAEERPRATLANPDEALRSPPPFREGEPRPVAARRGSAGPPPPPLESLAIPDAPPPPREARPARPPPRREDGQVLFAPGGPVTTTGGAGAVRSTISPQGPGVAIQQGPTTTIIGPGGQTQVVPTPR